jgi:hypothetical protein
MKHFLTLCIATCWYSTLWAQDSTHFYERIKLSLEANCYYVPSPNRRILLPNSISAWRGFFANDNPLYHGPSSVGLRIENELIKNYKIDLRIMTEHRGVSYGVFNTASMIVYPILKFTFVDTIRWRNFKWILSGSAGQERDFQQGNGLYLYNLNCHADRLCMQFNPNLIFEAFHIGDLSNGIGLGLDEVFQLSILKNNILFGKNELNPKINLQFTLTQCWMIPQQHYGRGSYFNPAEKIFLPEIMATLWMNPTTQIYAHLGFKSQLKSYQIDSAIFYKPRPIDNLAAVLGAKWQRKSKKWTVEAVAEARFYGKSFNYERSVHSTSYRAYYSFYNYNATIGKSLYPLASYDRPFSQWAVFTEYRQKNVGGLTLRTKGNVQLKTFWYAYFDLDYNNIFAEGETPFHYFFGTLGIDYKFRPDIDLGIGLTNKGMNLDLSYPTFYFQQKPSFLIFFKKALAQ